MYYGTRTLKKKQNIPMKETITTKKYLFVATLTTSNKLSFFRRNKEVKKTIRKYLPLPSLRHVRVLVNMHYSMYEFELVLVDYIQLSINAAKTSC